VSFLSIPLFAFYLLVDHVEDRPEDGLRRDRAHQEPIHICQLHEVNCVLLGHRAAINNPYGLGSFFVHVLADPFPDHFARLLGLVGSRDRNVAFAHGPQRLVHDHSFFPVDLSVLQDSKLLTHDLFGVLHFVLFRVLTDAVDDVQVAVPRLLNLLVDDSLGLIIQTAALVLADHDVLDAVVNQVVARYLAGKRAFTLG